MISGVLEPGRWEAPLLSPGDDGLRRAQAPCWEEREGWDGRAPGVPTLGWAEAASPLSPTQAPSTLNPHVRAPRHTHAQGAMAFALMGAITSPNPDSHFFWRPLLEPD